MPPIVMRRPHRALYVCLIVISATAEQANAQPSSSSRLQSGLQGTSWELVAFTMGTAEPLVRVKADAAHFFGPFVVAFAQEGASGQPGTGVLASDGCHT